VAPSLTPAQFRRHWRVVTFAGMLGMTYFMCITGAPLTKYLVDLQATPFDFGVISSLSAVALVFQIISGMWTNRIRRRKVPWIVLCVVQRLIFIGVLIAPTLFGVDRARLVWIIFVMSLNSALMNLSTPIWFSWMTDLVPHESLNIHWAIRQRFISAGTIVAQVVVALVFNHFETHGQVVRGFSVIAIAGIVLGVTDILLFSSVPEPPHEGVPGVRLWASIVEPLQDLEFRPYLFFRAYWNFALFVSAPFFAVYLIKELQLSTMTVQLVFLTSSLGMAMASGVWGMLCDTYGHRPAIRIASLLKPLVPLTYIVVPPIAAVAVPLLALLSFVDGMTNAGMQIATQGVMLKNTPRRNRAMYIATTNFLAMGIAGGLAPFISGALIDPLTSVFSVHVGLYHFTGYHIIFFISLILRAGAFPLTRFLREPDSQPARRVISHFQRSDSLRVVREVGRLRDKDEPRDRMRAALQLGKQQNPMAVYELTRALDDASPRVRSAAADALGRIGDPEAYEALSHALEDSDSVVQFRAARSLGRLNSEQSTMALTEHLPSLDEKAFVEAVRVLVRDGGAEMTAQLQQLAEAEEDDAFRERLRKAIVDIGAKGR